MSIFQNKLVLVFALLCIGTGAGAQERGMYKGDAVFIGRGTVAAGVSFGFDSWEASGRNGFDLLGIIKGLDGYVREADVAAQGAWFVGDNLSVGFRFGYSDTRISMDSTQLADIGIPDRHVSRQAFNGALTCRRYLPLFDGRIAAMFLEGRLSGSVGYLKNYRLTSNGKEGDYDDVWKASAGLYPGISLFATRNMAFEVSMPLLEGGFRRQKQDGTTTDGTLSRAFLNFKPNLTGLRMGLVYHF